jgi:regulator of RNase E activity RraA
LERFRELPTAAVSGALDRMQLPGAAFGIKPLFDGARVVGRAYTVLHTPGGIHLARSSAT